jgi:type I restriction enzyme S subunit
MNIPSGWKNALLHRVADVRSGLSKSSRREGATVKKPYLRVANVQDGFLDLTEIKEIDVPVNQVARFTLKAGDLLLIEGNGNAENLGRGCLWDGQIENCVHQNHVFAVRILPDANLLPRYLAFQLQSDHGRNYLLSCAKGTTGLSTLNSTQLREFPLIIPPVPEQLAITDAIHCWSAAIEKTERLIAAKEKRKAGLMAELLTGRRRVGEFKTAWRSWHLGELFQERVETSRGDLLLLSIAREEGVVPRGDMARKDSSNEDKTKYLRICPGDIGYNTMRMWQGVSALSRYDGIVSPAYTVCIPGSEIDGKFASYLFKLPEVINLFYRHSQGLTSDTWNLKFHHFAEIRVRIPEVVEQVVIARVLALVDEELAILQKQRKVIIEQKRGLMQKLLTGQWRMKVPKPEAPQP